jgi:DNA-binding transcriptional LysR family regulator
MMPLSLRRLKVFASIAKHQSITRAADALFMTPPAVTKSLRELETYLQSDLFERTSKGMVLTHSGETFLSYASRALNEIEQGELEVERLTMGDGGKVSVGATVETGVMVLPRAIGKLIAKRPNMDVSLKGGSYEELSQGVRTGTLDFFLGMAPDEDSTRDLEFTPMYQDQLHLIVRKNHPLLEKENLTIEDILELRWLLTARDGQIVKLLKRSLESMDATLPDNPIIVEPFSFFRGTAQATDVIAVVSGARLIAEEQLQQLVKLPIELPETHHIVGIVERNDPYRSSFSKELISLIQTCAKELGLPVKTGSKLPTPQVSP